MFQIFIHLTGIFLSHTSRPCKDVQEVGDQLNKDMEDLNDLQDQYEAQQSELETKIAELKRYIRSVSEPAGRSTATG